MLIAPESVRTALARHNRANMDATCDAVLQGDDGGGFDDPEPDPVTAFEGLRCRVAAASSVGMAERTQQAQRVTVAPFIVFIDGVHAVTEGMTLTVTYDDDSPNAGRTERFAVELVEDPISFQIQTVCQCTRAR